MRVEIDGVMTAPMTEEFPEEAVIRKMVKGLFRSAHTPKVEIRSVAKDSISVGTAANPDGRVTTGTRISFIVSLYFETLPVLPVGPLSETFPIEETFSINKDL